MIRVPDSQPFCENRAVQRPVEQIVVNPRQNRQQEGNVFRDGPSQGVPSDDSISHKSERCGTLVVMTDVTQILGRIENGDASAAEQLLPLVYEEGGAVLNFYNGWDTLFSPSNGVLLKFFCGPT